MKRTNAAANWKGGERGHWSALEPERRKEFRAACQRAKGKAIVVSVDRHTRVTGTVETATPIGTRKAGRGWAPLAKVTMRTVDGTLYTVHLSTFTYAPTSSTAMQATLMGVYKPK